MINKFLSVLFLATNIINTSSSYDRSTRAPFRLEKVSANYDQKNIKVTISYFINTHEPTEIYFLVNDYSQQDFLSKTKAKKSLREISVKLPNDGENNTLDLNFAATWSQEYNMDGTFFFANGEKDRQTISEPGEYKYKVIEDITFTNRNKKFSYKYDYININVYPQPINKYSRITTIADVTNANTTSKIKLTRNAHLEYDGLLNLLNKTILKHRGNYQSNLYIKYRKGGVYKNIELDYSWKVLKNYKGDCKTSYICLTNDKIKGQLEEVISTFIIL